MIRRSEAWLGCYLLIGLAQNGMAPILLPLAARGDPDAGLSYAAFALTGVTAPILGNWADREGRHRDLLIWGAVIATACFLPLCFLPQGLIFIFVAGGAGLGITAATTAGNVLAIAGLGENFWNDRIALLQRAVSTGQVFGLLLAGILAAQFIRIAFACAFVALLAASILAINFAPTVVVRATQKKPMAHPQVGGEAGAAGVQQNAHHFSLGQFRAFISVISPALTRFLLVWFISYTAMNGIAVLFPVIMTLHYGMSPIFPAVAYAFGICASLFAYRRVSKLTTKYGSANVIILGLLVRLCLFGVLGLLSLFGAHWAGLAVLVAFALVQLSWPLLAISTISISVSLVPQARGESIGLFNATSSVASSAGAAIGGIVFGLYGFSTLSFTAVGVVGTSVLLAWFWFGRSGGISTSLSHSTIHIGNV
jgi:MFS family permease